MCQQRICQCCDAVIPAERLEVMPETSICVVCSNRIGGEFAMSYQLENLAEPNSAEKIYGGPTNVTTTRKPLPRLSRELAVA